MTPLSVARYLKDHNPDQQLSILDLPYSILVPSVVSKPTQLQIEDEGDIMQPNAKKLKFNDMNNSMLVDI